jgi:hypothetical protein
MFLLALGNRTSNLAVGRHTRYRLRLRNRPGFRPVNLACDGAFSCLGGVATMAPLGAVEQSMNQTNACDSLLFHQVEARGGFGDAIDILVRLTGR